ncbi:hypothetical protein CV093_17730 [Oceanobacillus sp. 143]|nr:hypothetical protein CV093_17730 [Oceanobacillus sp. 143]
MEGNYTIASLDEAGKWTFDFINAMDHAGNNKFYYETDFTDNNNLYFNVINEAGDSKAPVVESVEVSPNEVGVGEQVTVKARATDENSGVKNVTVFFDSPSKNRGVSIQLKYNETTKLWEGNYTIASLDEAGKWTFDFINAIDHAGNNKFYYETDFTDNNNLYFNVINEAGDSKAPVVESVEVSPNEVGAGERVTVKTRVTDKNSGVKNVTVFFDSPSKNRGVSIQLKYNETTELWEGNYTIASLDEVGKWTFDFINAIDRAGNNKFYYEADFKEHSNLNFTINPELNINDPDSPYYITTANENWSNKVIDKDVYIGPDSIITINGNVEITGDVYVYGALKSYGGLKINGTLNAKNVSYGYSGSLNHGSVQFLGGSNSIGSTKVSNQPYEIPFDIFSENLTNETGSVQIEGKTLPFLDVYVQGQKVSLNNKGLFSTTVNNVTSNKIPFEIIDVFGNTIDKNVTIEDVTAPDKVTNFNVVENGPNSIEVNWDKITDTDIESYSLYKMMKKLIQWLPI